jgi:hypothetical protein
MNDKLKALAQKWDGENGDYPESKRDCAAELRALAATLTPLGDKDREAVAVLTVWQAGELGFGEAVYRKADVDCYIATRLAESGGGEVINCATECGPDLCDGTGPRHRTTPPAAAVESDPCEHDEWNTSSNGKGYTCAACGEYMKDCDPASDLDPPTPSAGVSEAMVEGRA